MGSESITVCLKKVLDSMQTERRLLRMETCQNLSHSDRKP